MVGGAQQARDSTDPEGGSAVAGNSRFIGYGWTERGIGRDMKHTAVLLERCHFYIDFVLEFNGCLGIFTDDQKLLI